MKPYLLIVVALLLAPVAARAGVEVTREGVERGIALERGWRYHPGDDAAWADPALDDAAWEQLESPEMPADEPPASGWPGIGWFRLRLDVAPDAVGIPISLGLFHLGASEVYLDGRLVSRFGVVAATPDAERPYNPESIPLAIHFDAPGEHVVAVRYSNAISTDRESAIGRWLARRYYSTGISAQLREHERVVRDFGARMRFNGGFRIGGVCILVTLATLHLLLFAFYRGQRANLFYGLFCLGLSAVITVSYFRDLSNFGVVGRVVASSAVRLLLPCVMTSFLAFLHSAFSGGVPRYVPVGLAVWLAAVAAYVLYPSFSAVMVVFPALVGLDGLRVMVKALRTRKDGARIVGAGVVLFSTVVARDVTQTFVGLPEIVHMIVEPASVLGLALTVSVYLARGFARTNRDLEAQLAEVRRLAAIEIEHERKANELEEARQLQLSMLPAKLPDLPHLEIAAYMKAATEVGGDYYDFDLAEDGTLTVAVGDATGHGLKAGTMVAATKSLFKAFAREPEIPRIFSLSTRALKQMNLRYLYMGLLVMKVDGHRMRVATAGMPPLLLHRAATGEVEEFALTGMPLGCVASFPYKEREIALEPGDTVVAMSDGFPERFNEQGEMPGYEAAREVLAASAGLGPHEVVERFVEAGEAWAAGAPQNDDVTFVVLKVRDQNGRG